MNRSTVCPLLEGLEPRVLFASPDLEVTILDATGPDVMVPGDKGTIKVQIKNVGTAPAVGTVDTVVRASVDTTFVGTDPLLGQVTGKKINLGVGKSCTVTVPGVLPDEATPDTYHLIAHISSALTMADPGSGNDTAMAAETAAVEWHFGAVGARTNVRMTLHDGATPVVFGLTGPGVGTVGFSGAGFDTGYVTTTGTTAASALSITAPKGVFPTMAFLSVLDDAGAGTGALKSLAAGGLNLENGVSVDGVISSLTVHNIHSIAHYIMLNAGLGPVGASDAVTIKANVINGVTMRTNGLPIKSFTAANITGLDLIAPWMGSMTVSSKLPGEGNLNGSIALDAEPPSDMSLGKLTVSGIMNPLTLNAHAQVGAIKTGDWLGGALTSGAVKSVTTAGDLNITVSGIVTAAKVGGDLSGTWTGWAGKIAVDGDMTNATLQLGGAGGVDWYQLESLTVKGWIYASAIRSKNPIGPITAGGMEDSTLLLGVTGTDLPDAIADFDAAHTTRFKSITVKGIKDASGDWVDSFVNTNIAAWQIDSISFGYADTVNATPFGVAAHSIGKLTYKHFPGSAGPATTSAGPMTLAEDSVTIDDLEIRILTA